MKNPRALLTLLGAVALAACSAAGDDDVGSQEQNAQPIDRLLIGKAAAYPADLTMRQRAPLFDASMAARRKTAWDVIARTVAPVAIATTEPEPAGEIATNLTLPRFQTWHAREEILPMFDRLFRGLDETARARRAPFDAQAIEDVFPWNATRATSLASFTQARLDQRRAELATPEGLASLGKDPRVLMSPDYVQHLFESYGKVLSCKPSDPIDPASGVVPTDPESPADFAPCLEGEFPPGAVAIKTRWMPSSAPVPVYDTSASALRARLAENGTFPEAGDTQADPTPAQAYTMQITPDARTRLVALHIMTKELRDWVWITMWWSPEPNSDFGADRPASLGGVWANYKMCVVTAYDEKDKLPGGGFPKTLADALDATNESGPATWCSNPYLETMEHGAKTNCIGCHQHGGTRETSETLIANPDLFPDNTRKRVRRDFPVDYTFTTEGGLELASEMRNRVEAISPTPAPAPVR
ncbi:MAG: hypothetical protein KIT84_13305 [Labilithrix sp.]|nr:hypothetical protein [Labilithrix sp.]MCW5811994.1 hypothetical protein [Labilithrix sp.]